MLIIVDYGMGNIASVANAFRAIGADPVLSSRKEDLERATRVILPGVGAFGEAMDRLRERGLVELLGDVVLKRKVPCLGICLGMQLLAETSHELGTHAGLGWIEGTVKRLEPSDATLHIPHIGWNDVKKHEVAGQPAGGALFAGSAAAPTFYFVHSFQFVTKDPAHTMASCDYGGDVTAVVAKDHIFGTQFHPEKSQKHGLALLKSFLTVTGSA